MSIAPYHKWKKHLPLKNYSVNTKKRMELTANRGFLLRENNFKIILSLSFVLIF